MITLDALSSGVPLLVETLLEDLGPGGAIHVLFGMTVAFTLLAGVLLIGYSSSFARSSASRLHNESALALWYGIVAWVVVLVAAIVIGVAGPPIAYLGGVLPLVVEMVGYAGAAIALGVFVLQGPLEDTTDRDGDHDDLEAETVTTPSSDGFDGVSGGEANLWLALVVGTIPIALLVIVPFVGGVLSILISGIGIGAIAIEYLDYEEPTPTPAEG